MPAGKVHRSRALPARYVPPSGFGYPRGGFLPFRLGRFCFAPAALLGFTLRSFLLIEGFEAVSSPMDPPTVGRSPRCPKARASQSAGFWALIPRRVPGGQGGISALDRWMLPWVFAPPGLHTQGLVGDFAPTPLPRLAMRRHCAAARPRLRVSIGQACCPSIHARKRGRSCAAEPRLADGPRGVSAPVRSQAFEPQARWL
jgi:hypothetical protein